MKATLTITDLTRMQGDRVCVAGYLPDNTCVRPVFAKGRADRVSGYICGGRLQSALSRSSSSRCRAKHRCRCRHIPKTGIIDATYRVRRDALTPEERAEWCAKAEERDVAAIFGAAHP